MTTYQKITISGNTADIDNSIVVKSLGETSSSSKFEAYINK